VFIAPSAVWMSSSRSIIGRYLPRRY